MVCRLCAVSMRMKTPSQKTTNEIQIINKVFLLKFVVWCKIKWRFYGVSLHLEYRASFGLNTCSASHLVNRPVMLLTALVAVVSELAPSTFLG